MVWTTCISAFYNFGINGYCVDLCKRFSRQNIITDGIIQNNSSTCQFLFVSFPSAVCCVEIKNALPATETVCAYRFRKNSRMVIYHFAWMLSSLIANWTLSISLIQFSIANWIIGSTFTCLYATYQLLEAGWLALIVQLAINTIWNNNNTERME